MKASISRSSAVTWCASMRGTGYDTSPGEARSPPSTNSSFWRRDSTMSARRSAAEGSPQQACVRAERAMPMAALASSTVP